MTGKGVIILSAVLCVVQAAVVRAYDYDANDFATEVVSYVQGTGVKWDILSFELYNNPTCALGRPTLETSIDETTYTPVNPVYPAWRAYEVVTIGKGGELIVKFNHAVADDPGNPYGIDFIVFGNAVMDLPGLEGWYADSNPEDVEMTGVMFVEEPGIVSVSQDGAVWYVYDGNDSARADSFAPTASYNWDDVNDLWADELDPTRPVDPNLEPADMNEVTVAEGIEMYEGSAGGAGFDISVFGLDWIQYVRIQDDPDMPSGVTTEIDAVSDVSSCGDYRHPIPAGDVNGDCRVDYEDMAVLSYWWLVAEELWDETGESADIYQDGEINFYDLAELGNNWLSCTWGY